MKVIVASPLWSLNGVNVFAANLVRGLIAAGVQAHVLLTEPHLPDLKPLPRPAGVPFEVLPVRSDARWPARWRAMIRYLEERAPCIYLPNHDFRHSCVSPCLPKEVRIAGIVHSDDEQHYEHAARLGRYWDAVVAVSPAIATEVAMRQPDLAPRLATIPYGVAVPAEPPSRPNTSGAPLRLIYAGRLIQDQKRVLDLPRIMAALRARGVPAELSIVGSGADAARLQDACASLAATREICFLDTVSSNRLGALFRQADVLILPSAYEGLPISLLEAMAQGCIPVVSDIRSGIPELVAEGDNGFRVPVGDIEGFAERLALLQRDRTLRLRLAAHAYRTVADGGYSLADMVRGYTALFERVLHEAESNSNRCPRNKILPPPSMTWKGRLRSRTWSLGQVGRRLLHLGQ